jgi:dTDP-4-dehydrorhamnose 3,5-epimerase
MIEGIKITPLKQIKDERGKVMHMLRNDSENFTKFGEIYFSTAHPNKVKGWHLHSKMTLNYAVVLGEIKLVLYDSRTNSKTKGQVQEFFLSQENYKLISVPPLIWNGFMNIGNTTAIVANCADLPYDDTEIKRKSAYDEDIPYDWKKNISSKLFE